MSHARYYTLREYMDYRQVGREPELAWRDTTPDEFDAWRDRLAERLEKAFGPMPEPVDLRPETLLTKSLDGIRAEKIVFDSSDGMSVPAWLLIPDDGQPAKPRPTVLLIPGHTGDIIEGQPGKIIDRTSGKAWYVGLDPDGNPKDTGDQNDIGQALARAGFVVLCPDLLAFGERSSDPFWARNQWLHVCDLHADALALFAEFSLPAVHLFDLRRCVEYLETRPEADLDRLAVAGHSLGGMYATYLSVLDRRFKATVANCSYPSFEARARGAKLGICGAQAVRCEPLFADSSDLLSAIAPHPLLMLFGDQDPGMTVQQAEAVSEKVCGAYASVGAADRCTAHIFQAGHAIDTPTIVPWLQHCL